MKKFRLHIILGILLFNMGASVIFFALNKGLRTYEWTIYNQFDLLFKDKEEQDILFIGSSRVHYGISCLLLEKLSGIKCLNAGLEGAKINEMEVALNGYLSVHKQLKEVFIMPDLHSFSNNEDGSYNKIEFAGYLDNDTVKKYLRNCDGIKVLFWKYIPYSILTEFDDYKRSMSVKGLFNHEDGESSDGYYKGYKLLKSTYTPIHDTAWCIGNIRQEKLQILKRMIHTCLLRNVKVTVIPGAYYGTEMELNRIRRFYNAVYAGIDVLGIRKADVVNYSDKNLFKDQTHLNALGAQRFTKDIIKILNNRFD